MADTDLDPVILAEVRGLAGFILLLATCSNGLCALLVTPQRRTVRFGWGYDESLPLSAKPAASRITAADGREDHCWAWLGFYVGFTTAVCLG